MNDNQIEKLLDVKNVEGNYRLGDAIYDRQGNFIETLEEYKQSVKDYE